MDWRSELGKFTGQVKAMRLAQKKFFRKRFSCGADERAQMLEEAKTYEHMVDVERERLAAAVAKSIADETQPRLFEES